MADKQVLAQLLLQRLDPVADGCWRHVQLGRGALEAQMPRRNLEAGKITKRRKVVRLGHDVVSGTGRVAAVTKWHAFSWANLT